MYTTKLFISAKQKHVPKLEISVEKIGFASAGGHNLPSTHLNLMPHCIQSS
jgi:hypothetical protein